MQSASPVPNQATDLETIVAKMDDALAAANEGFVVLDESGIVTFSTQIADRLLEIKDSGRGRVIGAQLQTAEGKPVANLCDHCSSGAAEILCIKAEPLQKFIRLRGAPQARVFIINDITDEVRKGDAERNFLDIVAHDLRAGLVPVKTYAQMLATGVLGEMAPKQADALKAIDHCVERQVEKISSLLDMVKAEEDRLVLTKEPLVLLDVLKKAVQSIDRDASRRGMKVAEDFEPGGALLDGDAPRLQRVFFNLLARAVRQAAHGDAMGVELRYDGSTARVRVWDRSKNKSPDELELLKKTCREQAMDRARSNTKPNIDLAAIHDIIKLHGGSIEVQQEQGGVGTSCLVTLPVKRPKSATQPGAQ